MFDEIKNRLGTDARELTLPFENEGVISFLQALRENRWLRLRDETFRVVAAEYDKHYDEVTFLLDFSEQFEEVFG